MLELFRHDPELAVAIAFVLAIALVGKKAWKAITGMLDARSAKIGAEIAEAERLRDEAQRALAEVQRLQRDAQKEAAAIVAHAKEEAQRNVERAQRDLAAALERRERLAAEKLALAESKALAEVRNAAVDIAIGAAREVIAASMSDSQSNALVDGAIADLPQRLH